MLNLATNFLCNIVNFSCINLMLVIKNNKIISREINA